MKTFAPFAMLVIAACAACMVLSSRPAAASCGYSPDSYIVGLAANTSTGHVVLTWQLCTFNYKMIENITRTPAFPTSTYPTGAASVIPPYNPHGGGGLNMVAQTFTDVDVKQGVTYTYTVCAHWTLAVMGSGPSPTPASHVPETSCSKPVSARLTYTVQRLGIGQLDQPTNVSAIRSNASTVGVSWSAPGGDNTAHFYLLSFTAAGSPPTNWKAPGWNNIAAVGPTVRSHNLSVPTAPSGQRNYFMVCAGNANDSAVNCSTPVVEKGLSFAPAPMAH
jgi:hypothetical protein